MYVSLHQLLVWLIIGALAGSLSGMLVKGSRKGFGAFWNLALGLAGALLGGYLFKILKVKLALGSIVIAFQDLVAAAVGSLLFLFLLWVVRR